MHCIYPLYIGIVRNQEEPNSIHVHLKRCAGVHTVLRFYLTDRLGNLWIEALQVKIYEVFSGFVSIKMEFQAI